MGKDDWGNEMIQIYRNELLPLRALCDEILTYLCQAKALLEPINEEDFFYRLDAEVLRHYFYALETLLDNALGAKDQICRMVDEWERV